MNDDDITEDERTNAVGLFNYACSYWKSAVALEEINIHGITHPGAPIDFLYVHAIELFLKSYLRLTRNVNELRNIGHRLVDLCNSSDELFSKENSHFKELIALIAHHKVNSLSRYIYTGTKDNYPTVQQLNELCNFLHLSVRARIKNAGLPVR
ncbi:hypothetical protein KIH24_12500 [Rhizobiales bacterium TNE-4]|nr:hypothetical protein [Rhizobiales bacterium TNE-4]MBV1828436.1 hypothetical protein [Rhizobiales bacterium TNE-4]